MFIMSKLPFTVTVMGTALLNINIKVHIMRYCKWFVSVSEV